MLPKMDTELIYGQPTTNHLWRYPVVENNVKNRRRELGMTLEQLSQESGVPVSTISDVERGIEPKVKTAQRIAWALNRTIDELWPEP